ncbi:mucin-2-like [Toxotes jaculatrix]|uniref:mucin-2-like n=1 Tax=Toxotes jaculatrix TaxID=941984 RepID=UPI001B3B05EF|nr:mucin-2-like [Toxotes jaculatrix]XP_040887555.1 mucin-2-like [Toxotes jaculatrix]
MEYHSGGSLPLLGRPRYCPGANANGGYLCETGHCCGETGCCTYYYELWWFWLLWTVLILFSCCCAYRHRRAKLRVQQQQRQREISLLAYHGANSYPSSMLDLSFLASLKLPSYEEVAAQPSTPPPPYSSVFTTPRYPQPPRTVDPHLLTQHGPLLHRPLSDGPSSLSSDNSSSCSCDSCCPSSPCSSSLSAPVTYETDTSHASTPSEAAPLTLDVTMETITAAATCLEVNEARFASETMVATVAIDVSDADAAGAQEPVATDSSVHNQTVTVAVVTRAASPQPVPSPGSEVALPVGATSPIKQQLDLQPCTLIVSACSSSTVASPTVVNTALPSIQIISIEDPAEGPESTPAPKITSPGPSTPTDNTSDRPTTNLTPDTLDPTRTFDTAVPNSPTSVPNPDVRRILAPITGSAGVPTLDPNPSLVPILAPSKLTQAPDPVPTNLNQTAETGPKNVIQSPEAAPSNLTHSTEVLPNLTQSAEAVPSNLIPVPDPQTKTTVVPDSTLNPVLTPAHSNLNLATDAALTSPTLAHCQNPELTPGSGLALVPASPMSDLPQHPGAVGILVSCLDPDATPADSGPRLVLSQFSESDIISPSDVQAGLSSGSGSCSGIGSRSGTLSAPAPVLTFPTPASSSSCPAITIEPESSFAPSRLPPSALSPSSPPSLSSPPFPPSPPGLPSTSLPAPALLLDPLTALHQSDKSGSSSGHASSLSPSPRATQSPPKQTLFSPCVDVFEPGPPNWDDEEEEQEEEDNDDDEDDDMGADESQYRHRRLTGDSGIEVCRCRVDEEDDEEEDEGQRKEDGRRGGGGERDKKGGGNTDLHDSVDCPARGQITTGEGLTLCNPTSSTTPTPEDSGEVVIVMETV